MPRSRNTNSRKNAAFAFIAASTSALISSVTAGELDIPGLANLAGLNRPPVPAHEPDNWKRAPSKVYNLKNDWFGSKFSDEWDFFYWPDPTNGMVNYQDAGNSWNKGLVSVTDSGAFRMKVDDKTWLPEGAYRDSVRITSRTQWQRNQLLVLDASHMPYGCGTWPAFWSVGANWPYGGEIDIVEGVNNNDKNQMTLHTYPGCEVHKTTDFAGSIIQNSCDAFYNDNVGCGIHDPSTKTYGKGFNNIGGGVFATLWDDNGISVWFFARNNIPKDLSSKKPNPSTWGRPRAYFSGDNCNMSSFFSAQTIVFDTTLCGDWGGATYQSGGCPGTCSQRVTNPNNFLDAYWDVNYVRIYN